MEEILTKQIQEKKAKYRQKKKQIFEPFYSKFHSETYLKNIINGRKVLIWSACNKSDWIYEKCVEYDIEIAGYIDSNDSIRQWNEKPVYRADVLDRTSYFVFVALENKYPDVVDILGKNGYVEYRDYLYHGYSRIALSDNIGDYLDVDQNEVIGKIFKFKVSMSRGSRLYIGKGCRIDESVVFNLDGGDVIIEDGCYIEKDTVIEVDHNSSLRLGKACQVLEDSKIFCRYNSILDVGDECYLGNHASVVMIHYASGYIGKGCLVSGNFFMRAGNSHNIFDLENKENRELYMTREINVGEHVWIGAHCVLLQGASIGNGSIVGMNSFVNKKYPENVAIAGNPSRIIRRNVAWDKSAFPYLLDEDVFREFDYRVVGGGETDIFKPALD